jgi:hypothetical protein
VPLVGRMTDKQGAPGLVGSRTAKAARAEETMTPVRKEARLEVRVTEAFKRDVENAAERAKVAPADWIRMVLHRAVEEAWFKLPAGARKRAPRT